MSGILKFGTFPKTVQIDLFSFPGRLASKVNVILGILGQKWNENVLNFQIIYLLHDERFGSSPSRSETLLCTLKTEDVNDIRTSHTNF